MYQQLEVFIETWSLKQQLSTCSQTEKKSEQKVIESGPEQDICASFTMTCSFLA